VNGEVIRLIDRSPNGAAGNEDLANWLRKWADAFGAGNYGDLQSLVVVVENKAGLVASVPQAIGALPNMQLIGLLTIAAKRADDGATIEDLEVGR
jgi:hypothetical protein